MATKCSTKCDTSLAYYLFNKETFILSCAVFPFLAEARIAAMLTFAIVTSIYVYCKVAPIVSLVYHSVCDFVERNGVPGFCFILCGGMVVVKLFLFFYK